MSPPQLNTRVLFIPAALSLAVLLLALAPGGCPRMPDEPGAADPNSGIGYDVWNSAGEGDDTLVDGETDTNAGDTTTVRVYPPVYFDLDVTEGDVPLTVTGQAFTMDGEPLPDGEYVWNWGDQEEGGPVTNFWRRAHTYVKTGTYAVGLSIVVAGLAEPIACTQVQNGKYEEFAKVKANATISGNVYDAVGLPLAGVQVTTTDGVSAKTGANGRYSMRVPHRWSGTVTPSLDGYTFSPPNRKYLEVTQSYSGQNYAEPAAPAPGALEVLPADGLASAGTVGGPFTPAAQTYVLTNTGGSQLTWDVTATQFWVSVSGTGGALAAGQSIRVTVSINTNANNLPAGSYSDTVTFTNVTGGEGSTTRVVTLQAGAAPTSPRISGRVLSASGVGVGGVTLAGLPTEVVTDDAGYYAVDVPQGWSGQVTPSATGYTFEPATRSYNNVVADQLDQNYNSTVLGFNISGHVTDENGAGLQDVVINGLPGSPQTGPDGSYTATVPYGFSGTATPQKSGYTFAPANRPYVNVTADVPEQDYVYTELTGPLVYGTITLVETVGARPLIGQQKLAFTGAGAFAGVDFVATTDVNGGYVQVVPEGWTGTVAAGQPDRMLLLTPADQWVYGEGGNAPAVSASTQLDLTVWTAPIGVPMPEFGIKETHWMYAGQRFDFDGDGQLEAGEEYPDAGNGPYTHYVDNTHPAATDTANPYGTPAKPRLTIPNAFLPAGSVAEIHGGPYTYSLAGRIPLFSSGTQSAPVFVRGASPVQRPSFATHACAYGSYLIVENFMLPSCNLVTTVSQGAVDHLVLRHSEVSGPGGGVSASSWASQLVTSHIVIYDVTLHTLGPQPWDDPNAGDTDAHAVAVKSSSGGIVRHVWVLDNHAYHVSGNFVQVGDYGLANSLIMGVYVGRNKAHHNRQSAIGVKRSTDVIVSQNTLYGHYLVQGANPGAGVSFQYSPENVWVIYNRIYESNLGIKSGSGSSQGGPAGQNCYIVGNLIYGITPSTESYNPDNAWSDAAMRLVDSVNRYIVGNTIDSAVAGIYCPSGGRCIIEDNIIANTTQGHHIFIQVGATAAQSSVSNCVLHQSDRAISIRWGGMSFSDIPSFASATGTGAECSEADPVFVGAGDYHVAEGSPAIDNGLLGAVYVTFTSLYGLSISCDLDGGAPVLTRDVGSYEHR